MDRSAHTNGARGTMNPTCDVRALKWVSSDALVKALQTTLCLRTFKVMFPDQLFNLWSGTANMNHLAACDLASLKGELSAGQAVHRTWG